VLTPECLPFHPTPHPQELDFSPLSALSDMRVLSISECPRMHTLPPELAGLTNLKVRAWARDRVGSSQRYKSRLKGSVKGSRVG